MPGAYRAGERIALANGRCLGFAQYGDLDGKPLLLLHGTPGSRVLGSGLDAIARRHGIRVVAPERPGCGLSDYWRADTVADWCASLIELSDTLGIERFSVLGASGGGPYALGVSVLLPERVDAVAIVSSVTSGQHGGMLGLGAVLARLAFLPDRVLGLPFALMARTVRRRPAAFAARLDRQLGEFAEVSNIGQLISDDLPGPRGAGADLKRILHWGFEPEQVRSTVNLWHGEDDEQVSVTAARELHQRLAGSEATFLPGEGHLEVLPRHVDEILNRL